MEASCPLLDAAGIEHSSVYEIGCPYISGARATLLRKAMQSGADVFVFLDDDVSWAPTDLVTLIETKDDVVSGFYRYKLDDEQYMGVVNVKPDFTPKVRADGLISAWRVPAGFLKVTRSAVGRFMAHYPHLGIVDEECFVSPDLFNHGAYKGTWYGEDYAFSRNWIDCGGELWVVPDLNLDHNEGERVWKGNFHNYMLRQPGGMLDVNQYTNNQ